MRSPESFLTLSWRIGRPLYMTEAYFDRLVDFLTRHHSVVDEVAFFETASHHLYLPMEFFRETATTLRSRIRALKSAGIRSVGINVLTTMGHVNEAWDFLPPLPFQPIVGHDGSISKSCACPNTPPFREYIREKYLLFAKAEPDFIWVDDDLRMHHKGVAYGCFCPNCLEILSRTVGKAFDRPELVKALSAPSDTELRAAWVEQNVRTLESLLAEVACVIHGENPAIRTGLMTAGPDWTTYSGMAFDRWYSALEAAKARPGGGFYSDEVPFEAFHKAIGIGRQCVLLPEHVRDCQYELENFPYATMNKAASTVINECTLALSAGCNGVAFNALGAFGVFGDDTFDDKEPLLARIEAARPFWQQVVEHAAGTSMAGLWPAWHPQLMARRTVREGEDWFAWSPLHSITVSQVLAKIGVPVAAASGEGTILSGRVAEGLDEGELRRILSGGVLMDAFALEALWQRGLGEHAGARIALWIDNGVAERFTDNPLNGPYPRALRDIRNEFWGDPYLNSALLEPLSPQVHVLSELETYLGERVGPCLTAFENALGGRVIVMGYAPWRFINLCTKRAQILNVADWATRGGLCVRIREAVTLTPLVRLSPDRHRGAIVLLNAGFDPIERATVEVRAPVTPVRLAASVRDAVALHPAPADGGWSVVLKNIPPWSVVALLLG